MYPKFFLTLIGLLAAACSTACTDRTAAAHGASVSPPASQPISRGHDGKAHDALAQLDHRTPVPMPPMMAWHQKQNMMAHLVAIQQIVAHAAQEDWDAIDTAASRIGSSPQTQKTCEHMGAGAEGFTERALMFHQRADDIRTAAQSRDLPAVLRATSTTLDACTGCHATYRQQVIDMNTWHQITATRE